MGGQPRETGSQFEGTEGADDLGRKAVRFTLMFLVSPRFVLTLVLFQTLFGCSAETTGNSCYCFGVGCRDLIVLMFISCPAPSGYSISGGYLGMLSFEGLKTIFTLAFSLPVVLYPDILLFQYTYYTPLLIPLASPASLRPIYLASKFSRLC